VRNPLRSSNRGLRWTIKEESKVVCRVSPTERPATLEQLGLDWPLTLASSNMCNKGRVYNDRLAFRRQWTHLFPAAKQASTHVAYKATISLGTISILVVVFSIRQVVIAPVVRHCDRRTAPGSSWSRRGAGDGMVPRLRCGELQDGPRVSARDKSHMLNRVSCRCGFRDFRKRCKQASAERLPALYLAIGRD
jgi:hypothetical protein